MILFADIFGIVLGLALGISIALLITVRLVKQSNDIGDSQGEFMDFGDYVHVLNEYDNLSSPVLAPPKTSFFNF